MANENETTETPVAAAAAPEVSTAVVAEVVASEVAAVADKPFEHTDVPSLLVDAPKTEGKPVETKDEAKPEDKPADKQEEAKTEVEAKPGDKNPEEKAPDPAVTAEPVEYKFTAPEGVKLDDAKIGAFTDVARELNLAPDKAQGLLDMHTAAMQAYGEQVRQEQQRAFADYRQDCKTRLMADEQLGGAGFETTKAAVARMRDRFVPEKYQQEFNDFLNVTGAGEQPAMWRLLYNIAREFDEPPSTPVGGTPPPGHGKPPKNKQGMGGLYDKGNSALYGN